MAILSRGRKPDNFESNKSLKLSCVNTQGLRFKGALSGERQIWQLKAL